MGRFHRLGSFLCVLVVGESDFWIVSEVLFQLFLSFSFQRNELLTAFEERERAIRHLSSELEGLRRERESILKTLSDEREINLRELNKVQKQKQDAVEEKQRLSEILHDRDVNLEVALFFNLFFSL